ncbi:MAG: signal peptidase I [Clostridium sp.]|nr:signal peptidase I [Clostridium sp.]
MKRIAVLCAAVVLLSVACVAFAEEWTCSRCGRTNDGNFCPNCGAPKPEIWVCLSCEKVNTGHYCENCGAMKPVKADSLLGTWQFSVLGVTSWYTFIEDMRYENAVSDGEWSEGTYRFDGINLILTDTDGRTMYYGEWCVSGDSLVLDIFMGTGSRTADMPRFTLRMDGESMLPAINHDDTLSIERRDSSEMKRFDMVVVKYPSRGSTLFVKRLIGLPGDEIELRDGYLFINGEQYAEPYIDDAYRVGKLNQFGPYVVPEGTRFVLGDHRNNSNDSRFIGPIPDDMMIGVVVSINGIDLNE